MQRATAFAQFQAQLVSSVIGTWKGGQLPESMANTLIIQWEVTSFIYSEVINIKVINI